mmetsp:Transcript_21407/g.29732  ORF Transcript_21407/g.29732 Transcript_21407/m.29732 type:complete len:530 (-) Transcript_21407:76-1665(-)
MIKLNNIGDLFWKQDVQSVRSPEGVARILEYGPSPLSLERISGLSRALQVHILQKFFDIPVTPSFVKSSGGMVLDRVVGTFGGLHWWGSSTLRVRAQSIWSHRRNEEARPLFKSDMYGVSSRVRCNLAPDTVASGTCELGSLAPLMGLLRRPHTPAGPDVDAAPDHPTRSALCTKDFRGKLNLTKKIPMHDLIAECALNERCIDAAGGHWDVPHSLSLDVASHPHPEKKYSYRLGVHKAGTASMASDSSSRSCPTSQVADQLVGQLVSHTHAQAAIQFTRSKDIWIETRGKRAAGWASRRKSHPPGSAKKKKEEEVEVEAFQEWGVEEGRDKSKKRPLMPYGAVLQRPRVSLSGGLGGLLRLPLGGSPAGSPGGMQTIPFAHAGMTVRVGEFVRPFMDFTQLALHLRLGGEAIATLPHRPSVSQPANAEQDSDRNGSQLGGTIHPSNDVKLISNSMTLALSQQLLGPVRGRVDARVALVESPASKLEPRILETCYGLDCALPPSGATRLVLRYSPSRQEALAEIRVLES